MESGKWVKFVWDTIVYYVFIHRIDGHGIYGQYMFVNRWNHNKLVCGGDEIGSFPFHAMHSISIVSPYA
jgi:hypothetical protein